MTTEHRSSQTTRRRFVAGATAAAGAAALSTRPAFATPRGRTPLEAARHQATPEADFRPSLHSYPLVQEKTTFTALVPHYGIDWINNAFTRWYEERTNVHIEFRIVEDDAALTQLNLQLASGDYPDIILGFNWAPFELTPTTISAYGGQGIFVSLGDHLANNAPNYNEYVLKEYPIAAQLVTMPDGQVYAMPQINDCYHCHYTTNKQWIQTAWLETLGLERPTTIDEFEAVLQAFKTGDPNSSGAAEEVPFTSSVGWPIDGYIMSPFQLNPGQPWLYNEGGTVAAAYMRDGWLEGTKYARRLADQDLLARDAFVLDADQIRQLGNNDQIGTAPGVAQGNFIQTTEGTAGLWSTFRLLAPLEGPGGTRQIFRNFNTSNLGNNFVVTDRCADPALAVTWADGLYAWDAGLRATFGVLDEDWRWADGVELGIDGEPAKYARIPDDPNAPDTGEDNTTSWSQLCPLFRTSDDRLSEAVINDRDANTEVLLYEGCKEELEPFANEQGVDLLRPLFTPEEAVRVSELESAIAPFVNTTFAQDVTGQSDPDSNRQPFLDQLTALGIDEYLSIQQTAFDRQSSTG